MGGGGGEIGIFMKPEITLLAEGKQEKKSSGQSHKTKINDE